MELQFKKLSEHARLPKYAHDGDSGMTLFNHTNTEVRIEKGDRVAQLVLAPVVRAHIVETDTLDDTERGADGFGSTGR